MPLPNPRLIPTGYQPQREDIFHIAGDDDDGYAADTRLTKGAEGQPTYRYKDRLVRCEVYRSAEGLLSVHSMCPRCERHIWIKQPNKHIAYDKATNTLSIESFECTWELNDGRSRFGNLCRLRIRIDNNVARDAR